MMKKITTFFLSGLFAAITLFAQNNISPENALNNYINNNDNTYAWEIIDSYPVEKTQAYSLLMVSQKWQGILWKHELIVFVPDTIHNNDALLFITGGSIKDNFPKFTDKDDSTSKLIGAIADKNKAVTAILRQTPNQPLYNDLYEDALIAYTLNELKNNDDLSWPLLFPMTKSAIRAMDVIQDFANDKLKMPIDKFLISGASKRGWTTWLSAATEDSRIMAIAPMVIDMLNMPVSLNYQHEVYGDYSDEIQDYVNLEIPQAINSEFGSAIVQMIDPYSYRDRLTMPKMIFMGTNDPYWTLDAVKHYIKDIPGHNLLHYVANAGHGLGDKEQAFAALNSFFHMSLTKEPLPVCKWNLSVKIKNIELSVSVDKSNLVGAKLWIAKSQTRDFRKSEWKYTDINTKSKSKVLAKLKLPDKGYQAFYIDLIYKDSNNSEYSISSRTFVMDNKMIYKD